MTDPTDETTSALEQFRREWKDEVQARARHVGQSSQNQHELPRATGKPRRISDVRVERPMHKPPTRHPVADIQDDSAEDQHGDSGASASSSMIQRIEGLSVRDVDDDDFSIRRPTTEPKSALEHYERAVERESQGNLGDSLAHYRKAYRLDAKVDLSYRNKHFPPKSKPTSQPNPSNAPVTVPNPAHHSSKDPPEILSTLQLIQSFADAPIQGAPPLIEGDIPPPCAIDRLPAEVLLELLQHVGTRDPALMMRLALVCKKLAYMIYTDNGMWKRIALGPEFGLAGQRYQFATDLQGREAIYQVLEEDEEDRSLSVVTESDFPGDTVWRDVFHNHPRIRFTGVYISTVNYSRPGGASATPNTWSNPIHIVTYYRYLRFFRDGTCISLLTTNEPIEVVHHLTKENLSFVRSSGRKEGNHPLNFTSSATALTRERESTTHGVTGTSGASNNPQTGAAPPPSAQQIMKHALRGRWRLCHPSLESPAEATSQLDEGSASASAVTAAASALSSPSPTISPGDLHIETEGAGPRYMYTMHLSLKSAGSARSRHTTKNNKLVWKGFWSYNVLTSDWAEFHLKNDKPFFFSRVRGYGLGY